MLQYLMLCASLFLLHNSVFTSMHSTDLNPTPSDDDLQQPRRLIFLCFLAILSAYSGFGR
ncbi:hypothetical protein CC78DRAFT_362339 [Lojkania enalia]|uniref:Uncharacterized protein n=1 Tax=Lojkania enalia TaxID=147567 RepID=A0A9P4K453_9PLEO|nr:hypothetical protein CC78DRAFT_362339 [Didymosphaeria enalia]